MWPGPRGEGGPGDGFFVVDSGEAQVSAEGQPRATIVAGDHFGEIALLLGSDRTATVTAITDLHCYALTPWDFRALVEENPSIALQRDRARPRLPDRGADLSVHGDHAHDCRALSVLA